jgi:hypothetical protein
LRALVVTKPTPDNDALLLRIPRWKGERLCGVMLLFGVAPFFKIPRVVFDVLLLCFLVPILR